MMSIGKTKQTKGSIARVMKRRPVVVTMQPIDQHQRTTNTTLVDVSKSSFRHHKSTNQSSTQHDCHQPSLSTISPSLSHRVDADFYGLPSIVGELYRDHRRISQFYDWQDKCLNDVRLCSGHSLVINTPTGGGKTLIAEILMLRQTLVYAKNALLILPFVAIVQEKIRALSIFADHFGICVEEYATSKGRLPPIKRRRNQRSLYIATIEKANMLINSLIADGRLDEVGLVVVDELHMLGEGRRGAVLEQTLAKVVHVAPSCQIVGLSATLNNIDQICNFLHASHFSCQFRPIELIEYIKVDNFLYKVDAEGQLMQDRELPSSQFPLEDSDNLLFLVQEVIPEKSCLIFCRSKKNAENVCLLIAKRMPKSMKALKSDEKRDLLSAMHSENDNKLCSLLQKTLPYGIAYHHSGLTADERRLIEEAYTNGVICVICSTSTLAAGVNLPAKRVIIRAPMVGNEMITKSQYKQMVGRAGRAGLDSTGDSITIVPNTCRLEFLSMLGNGLVPLCSGLDTSSTMNAFLLDLLALQLASSRTECIAMVRRTLFGIQHDDIVETLTNATIDQLQTSGVVITIDNDDQNRIDITDLGRAVHSAGIDVQLAGRLLVDLRTNLELGLVLSSHLHLIYCIVPYENVDSCRPLWKQFYDEWQYGLNDDERCVFRALNITEPLMMRLAYGRGGRLVDAEKMYKFRRLYVALMLNRLWKQERVWNVAELFGIHRGELQSLLQSTCSFANAVARFAERIPILWPYKLLLPDFVMRLSYCVRMELIPLMSIDFVRKNRASQLYDFGFKTVISVAQATVDQLTQRIDNLSRYQAIRMISSAKSIVRDQLDEHVEQIQALCGGDGGGEHNDVILLKQFI